MTSHFTATQEQRIREVVGEVLDARAKLVAERDAEIMAAWIPALHDLYIIPGAGDPAQLEGDRSDRPAQ